MTPERPLPASRLKEIEAAHFDNGTPFYVDELIAEIHRQRLELEQLNEAAWYGVGRVLDLQSDLRELERDARAEVRDAHAVGRAEGFEEGGR